MHFLSALVARVHESRTWRLVLAGSVCLWLGSCTQIAPTDSVPQVSHRDSRSPGPQRLNLALRVAVAVDNGLISQYLSQLPAPQAAQGIWMQSETELLANHQGTTPLPAASITKVATSLAALKTLGPDHRFTTEISATGPIANGVLQGDLVVQGGADPLFVWETAIALGNTLTQKGIQAIAGDLIIQGPFYMNFKTDPQQTGTLLKQGLNASLWPAEATAQYKTLKDTPKPQIEIQGAVRVVSPNAGTNQQEQRELISQQGSRGQTLLIGLNSLPLAELLKQMNRYSNNAMAEMLAQEVGGPQEVARIAAQEVGVPQAEIQLINGSGLGIDSRISPRAACGMMLAIANLLHPQQMTLADVFAVTGQDTGILDQRPLPHRTIVKSGTLNRVSALAGALPTQKQGIVWFAILNSEGNVEVLRSQQEALLQTLLSQWTLASETPPLLQVTTTP